MSLVPSPRQEDLFLPHVYRSPLEVTAACGRRMLGGLHE